MTFCNGENLLYEEVCKLATMQCIVDYVAFQNPENGFTVLQVHSNNNQDNLKLRGRRSRNSFRAVGTFDFIETGTSLELVGSWERHPRFGRQFTVDYYTELLPSRLAEIEEYLKSGHVKGIGKVYAKRIVEKFGTDTWNVLDFHPERLTEVKGIQNKTVEMVKESWSQNRRMQPLMAFLHKYGIGMSFAPKIYKEFEDQSIEIIKNNPYILIERIDGMGFKRADGLAARMGFSIDSPLRVKAGIQYWLTNYSDCTGSTYAYRNEIIEGVRSDEVLGFSCGHDVVTKMIDDMITDELLMSVMFDNNECIYAIPLYKSEKNVADNFLALQAMPAKGVGNTTSVDISHIEYTLSIEYNDEQKEAIRKAIDPLTKVMVITGGPGTGKTTVTRGIITGLKYLDKQILLAAPTGRAAKRMTEATGCEAKTIHRLLGSKKDYFEHNGSNPLEGDVLIVDESSMIDIYLMNSLLKAVPKNMKLIMIGDVDQLPSVGPGSVLRDLIDSDRCPVIQLTQIFRQAQTSQIICSAHKINEGETLELANSSENDLFFLPRKTSENAIRTVVDLVSNRLPKKYDIAPTDIQVLTPKKKGSTGSITLNEMLQQAINPNGKNISYGNVVFRENDKVIQQENDYEQGVFNGDVGIVSSVDPDNHSLIVRFDDGKEVAYKSTDLNALSHAYAITIHKSQGSEYPIVVMPILREDSFMLERNLLYTGVTRAKKILVLVGSRAAIEYAVKKEKVSTRKTLLKQRLCDLC